MPLVKVDLPGSVHAPAIARRQLADVIAVWGTAEHRETAVLLVSELVTNAVRHAASAPRMTVMSTKNSMRCTVYDADAAHPVARAATLDKEGGRGLLLVAALASAWGVQNEPAGKSVWFELRV